MIGWASASGRTLTLYLPDAGTLAETYSLVRFQETGGERFGR